MAETTSVPDLAMEDISIQPVKKAKKDKTPKGLVLTGATIRYPPWTYVNLELISSTSFLAPRTKLDELTLRTYLTAALAQFLGVTGSAISVDILKIEEDGRECWVRVPRDEASAFVAAVGGWIGGGNIEEGQREAVTWRVKNSGGWLGVVLGRRDGARVWD